MSNYIQIPEGKTEVRIADGSWVKIPEGVKEVDSSMLWQEQQVLDKQEETIEQYSTMQEEPMTSIQKQAMLMKQAQSMSKQERDSILSQSQSPIDRTLEVGEATARGMATPVLGMARAIEGVTDNIGITDADTNTVLGLIKDNEAEANRLMEKQGFDKDAILNPKNIGRFVAEALPLARVARLGTAVGTEALMGASSEYGTGASGAESAIAGGIQGATTLIGGKIASSDLAQKIFGSEDVVKEIKTSYGKEIDELPYDVKTQLNSNLDRLDELGISNLDAKARQQILNDIDLSKSTDVVSDELVGSIKTIKDGRWEVVDGMYKEADKVAEQTRAIDSVDVKRDISDIIKNKLNKTKLQKDERDAKKYIYTELKNMNTLNAKEIEDLTKVFTTKSSNTNDSGAKKIYSEARDYLRNRQESLLGDNKDVYNSARTEWQEYNRQFTGNIDGEGSELGKKINKTITNKRTSDVAESLLTRGLDNETVKQFNRIGLAQNEKTDAVKDILTKGLNPEDINTKRGVDSIINTFYNMDKRSLKLMLGNDYTKMKKNIESLDLVNSTMQDTVSDSIRQNVINFITNASMVKISPLYGAKGMVYEGKEIATRLAFKKEKGRILERVKKIKDKSVSTKLIRAIGAISAPSELSINTESEASRLDEINKAVDNFYNNDRKTIGTMNKEGN